MMPPLRRLAEGVPHGGRDSTDQSRGPLAVGARGGTHAQRGDAHRYLRPSAPRPCLVVWSGGEALLRAILDGHHAL
jgi:hypothetical protein